MSAVSTTPPTASPPGRRDAEATRTAILKAARHLLARNAHADITLKAVAERAGVSAPLILKYFGNKDALFARVMSFETDAQDLLDAPLDGLGRHMVRHVLVSQRERGADPLLRIAFAPCTATTATSCASTSAPTWSTASPHGSPAPMPPCAPNSPSRPCSASASCTASRAAPSCERPPSTPSWTATDPPCRPS